MKTAEERMGHPKSTPEGKRLLNLGEQIRQGDLMWSKEFQRWETVGAVAGDTTIWEEQLGWYCR